MTTDAPPEKMTNAPWKIEGCCCGSRGQLLDYGSRWFIECRAGHCLATSPMFKTEAEAVAWWNTAMVREAARRLSAPAGDRPPREPTPAMVDAGAVAMPMNDYESHSMHEVSLRARELIKAEWRAMWDAAPDLSAPTPAAPRVGDDGLARLPTQAMYKAAMEAAMGGVGGTDDIVNAAWNAMQGIEQDRSMPPHPLSAPPAARVDEREELAKWIEGADNAWDRSEPPSELTSAEFTADRLMALGYRKRAGQGVGALENAAQDAGRAIAHALGEGNYRHEAELLAAKQRLDQALSDCRPPERPR